MTSGVQFMLKLTLGVNLDQSASLGVVITMLPFAALGWIVTIGLTSAAVP